ncbi:MAG: hypothetical protein WD533_09850 [Dehalococcoidia bacterium]
MLDYTKADLDPQTRGMLDYAVKLTKTPWEMSPEDIQALRDLGLSDEQVLSTAMIANLFNFMTRLADGLGVDVPPNREQVTFQWLSDEVKAKPWIKNRRDG